jgi:hypothetical protein
VLQRHVAAADAVMSTATVREIVDKEEEEAGKKKQDEDEESDEEDDDYAPSAGEEDSDSAEGEGAYDDTVPEVSGGGAPQGAKKCARGATKAKKPAAAKKAPAKRKRAGGIALSDDDEAAGQNAGRSKLSEAQDVSESEAESQPAPAAASAASGKSSIDDLWAEMNGSAAKPKSAGSGLAGTAATSSAAASSSGARPAGPTPANPANIDIKALLAKTKGAAGVSNGSLGPQMVTITQKVDFCGEEIVVTKQVKAGSKEHVAYLQTEAVGPALRRTPGDAAAAPDAASPKSSLQQVVAASTQLQQQMQSSAAASGLEFKSALPAPKLATSKPVGLQGLLASLDGKKKMSTMEKSRRDWGGFKDKQDEQTRADMETFAKDGYLAKQAFLQRSDARQAEVARSNRRRGMGLKD